MTEISPTGIYTPADAVQDIATAPRDGRTFIAIQDGELYAARFTREGRLAFRVHALRVESKHRIIEAELDGKPVRAEVPIEQPWPEKFHHDWCLWTRGFEFKPTHWFPDLSTQREAAP